MAEPPDRSYLLELRQLLETRFSDGELRTLCFDLGIDYEILPGEGKADKARELLTYVVRHDLLADLVQHCSKVRPDIPWPDSSTQSGDPARAGISRQQPSRRDRDTEPPVSASSTLPERGAMSPRADLEQRIRDSYKIIREYELDIQTSDRPEDRMRAQRVIDRQWSLIEGYLAEYRTMTGGLLPSDIAELAAHFDPTAQAGQPGAAQAEMNIVADRATERFQFLRLLYDRSGGKSTERVRGLDLGRELGWNQDDTGSAIGYLAEEGLIELRTFGYGISITHEGIKQVEELARQGHPVPPQPPPQSAVQKPYRASPKPPASPASPITYATLEIVIGQKTGNGYPVRVHPSEVIPAARGTLVLDTESDPLRSLVQQIQDDDPERRGKELLTSLGSLLFERLFTDGVAASFNRGWGYVRAAGQGLRIQLDIESPELAALPWEYLYYAAEDHFFALSAATPLTRFVSDLRASLEPLAAEGRLRMLVLAASPKDVAPVLDLDAALKNIAEALERVPGIDLLPAVKDATPRAIREALRQHRPHIVHFVGHGYFEGAQAGVILDAGTGRACPLAADEFSLMFRPPPGVQGVRLLVLNACEGARASSTKPLVGVAHNILRHVPAVVAMQYPVTDVVARSFAYEFYRSLAIRYPVEAAVSEARNALYIDYGGNWGTPVLFLRSRDGQLFRPAASGQIPLHRYTRSEARPNSIEQLATPIVDSVPSDRVQPQARLRRRASPGNPFNYNLPATPDQFVGRWPQVKKIAQDLMGEYDCGYACIGGKRMGKSSLLIALHHYLCTPAAQNDYYTVLPIVFDCGEYDFPSVDTFFSEVLLRVCNQLDPRGPARSRDIRSSAVSLDRDWLGDLLQGAHHRLMGSRFEDGLDYVLRELCIAGRPTRLVLLFDEADDIRRYPWHAAIFAEFRHLLCSSSIADLVRVVFAGSRQFLDMALQPDLPIRNLLHFTDLNALDKEATYELMERASGLGESVRNAVWLQSGGHPFLAQYLLHHLWRTGAKEADEARTRQVVDRFLQRYQHQLEEWTATIGDTGLAVYYQLAHQPGWIETTDILETVVAAHADVRRALNALCYHGLVVHDGEGKRHRYTSELFRQWFLSEYQEQFENA